MDGPGADVIVRKAEPFMAGQVPRCFSDPTRRRAMTSALVKGDACLSDLKVHVHHCGCRWSEWESVM